MSSSFTSRFITAPDGLRLHVRLYGTSPLSSDMLPVVCLHGLSRNSADFHELAMQLSGVGKQPRAIIVPDYRGRGLSENAKNWRTYDIRIETNDLVHILTALGIERAIFIGTSRGGLITMALGATHPARIAGVVLNDIGPVVESAGLLRIRGYVGKWPRPQTWEDAVGLLKRQFDSIFPAFTHADWHAYARGTWHETAQGLSVSYDARLMKTLTRLDLEKPQAPLWPLFDTLAHAPLLVVRGDLSDLLSHETLTAMLTRHPDATGHVIAGQGHAPLLHAKDTLVAIERLIRKAQKKQPTTVNIR